MKDFIREEPPVEKATRIGMDTSKRFFQLHGVDASEQPALRRQLTRAQALPFFERLPATVVAMEACGAAQHWAELTRLGHEVRLIAPQLAKPYVARGKNAAADAAALCEAASRRTCASRRRKLLTRKVRARRNHSLSPCMLRCAAIRLEQRRSAAAPARFNAPRSKT